MTDSALLAIRDRFLFAAPPGFFGPFAAFDSQATPLGSTLSAFRQNLSSAFLVGSVPFQLVQDSVVNLHFRHFQIAELIRSTKTVQLGQTVRQAEEDQALEKAHRRMDDEMSKPETIERHAENVLLTLKRHVAEPDFNDSARELLRQVLVMTWSALEVLAGDVVRQVLNTKPGMLRGLIETKRFRDILNARTLLDALEGANFNLSSRMGDVVLGLSPLDSLEKIKDAISGLFEVSALDIKLADPRLWLLAQQRHLIVHRRGVVDARYLEKTSENLMVGAPIAFDAPYIEACLTLVRDVGCDLFSVARAELAKDA